MKNNASRAQQHTCRCIRVGICRFGSKKLNVVDPAICVVASGCNRIFDLRVVRHLLKCHVKKWNRLLTLTRVEERQANERGESAVVVAQFELKLANLGDHFQAT